jgi:hypothetical protein
MRPKRQGSHANQVRLGYGLEEMAIRLRLLGQKA